MKKFSIQVHNLFVGKPSIVGEIEVTQDGIATKKAVWQNPNGGKKFKGFPNTNTKTNWSAIRSVTVAEYRDLVMDGKTIRFGLVEPGTVKTTKPLYQSATSEGCYLDLDHFTVAALTHIKESPLMADSFMANYSHSTDFSSLERSAHFSFVFDRSATWQEHQKIVKGLYHFLNQTALKPFIESKTKAGKLDTQCFDPTRLKFGTRNEEAYLIWFKPDATLKVDHWVEYFEKNATGIDPRSKIEPGIKGEFDYLPPWFQALRELLPSLDWTNPNSFCPWQGFGGGWIRRTEKKYHEGEEGIQWDGYDYRNISQTEELGSLGSINFHLKPNGGIVYYVFNSQDKWRINFSGGKTFAAFLIDWFIANQPESEHEDLGHRQDLKEPDRSLYEDAIDFFLAGHGIDLKTFDDLVEVKKREKERGNSSLIEKSQKIDKPKIFEVLEKKISEIDYKVNPKCVGAGTAQTHFCKYFLEDGSGNIRLIQGNFYVHNGESYWQRISEESLGSFIAHHLARLYKEVKVKSNTENHYSFGTDVNMKGILSYCKSSIRVDMDYAKKFLNCLNFQNGVYDVKEKRFIPYEREMFFTYRYDIDFKPGAIAPSDSFLEAIDKTYGRDQLETIRGILRYYLDSSILSEHFVHILGESGSGKGTLIKFLSHLLPGQTGEVNFKSFSTPEMIQQQISGHKLLTISDASSSFQKDGINVFYNFVSHDSLTMRSLYSSTATMLDSSFSKIIIASTSSLKLENDEGWSRRVFVLKTKKKEGGKVDTSLMSKMLDGLEQTVSWIFGVEPKDVKQMFLTHTKGTIDADVDHSTDSDSVASFIDQCLSFDYESSQTVTKAQLFFAYKKYCEYAGKKSKSDNPFYKDVTKFLTGEFLIPSKSKTEGGKSIRVPSTLKGIGFAEKLFRGSEGTIDLVADYLVEGTLKEITYKLKKV